MSNAYVNSDVSLPCVLEFVSDIFHSVLCLVGRIRAAISNVQVFLITSTFFFVNPQSCNEELPQHRIRATALP